MPAGRHRIYYEQCGNPAGLPVVVLHGGPGGGVSPNLRCYFNPHGYRTVLFDPARLRQVDAARRRRSGVG